MTMFQQATDDIFQRSDFLSNQIKTTGKVSRYLIHRQDTKFFRKLENNENKLKSCSSLWQNERQKKGKVDES